MTSGGYCKIAGVESSVSRQDSWSHYDHFEGPLPEGFVPTKEWLSQKLRVPVKDCVVTEKPGGKGDGMSGAKFFYCQVSYDGPMTHPTFGLPTELFVKIRQPDQPKEDFVSEMVVGYLVQHMPDPPPMARVFWAGENSVVVENLKDYASTKQWKGSDGKCSIEEAKHIVKAYAHLHASFWKLPHVTGLQTFKNWSMAFCGLVFPKEVQERTYDLFGPHRAMVEHLRDELGYEKIFEWLSSLSTTLCQGDAHKGNVMKLKKHSDYAEEHGKWQLVDFGEALVANPAIDIGAFTLSVDFKSDDEYDEYLKCYWEELIGRLQARDAIPGMTFEQFALAVQIGTLWRVICDFCFEDENLQNEDTRNAIREYMTNDPILDQQAYETLLKEMAQKS